MESDPKVTLLTVYVTVPGQISLQTAKMCPIFVVLRRVKLAVLLTVQTIQDVGDFFLK